MEKVLFETDLTSLYEKIDELCKQVESGAISEKELEVILDKYCNDLLKSI